MADEFDADDLAMLALECGLQMTVRRGCECGPYLAERRKVLLPQVLKAAAARDEDPVDVLAEFMRGAHARHLAGHALVTP